MKTPITEKLGIEFPIFAFTHCRDVVAAVTKAGGMGVLGAAGHSAEQLAIDLEWIEKEVGDRPYGIDLLIPSKYVGASEGKEYSREEMTAMIPAGHTSFLDGVMARYNVPESDEEGGTALGRGRPAAARREERGMNVVVDQPPDDVDCRVEASAHVEGQGDGSRRAVAVRDEQAAAARERRGARDDDR